MSIIQSKDFVLQHITVYPDIILHKKWYNANNILAIEVKTWWNTDTDKNEKKLKNFTD